MNRQTKSPNFNVAFKDTNCVLTVALHFILNAHYFRISIHCTNRNFDPISPFIQILLNVCNHFHYKKKDRNKLFFQTFSISLDFIFISKVFYHFINFILTLCHIKCLCLKFNIFARSLNTLFSYHSTVKL